MIVHLGNVRAEVVQVLAARELCGKRVSEPKVYELVASDPAPAVQERLGVFHDQRDTTSTEQHICSRNLQSAL